MSLNYIIATYAGTHTEYALEVQLQNLLTIILAGETSCLKQITVMCPEVKPQHTVKQFYYDKIKWVKIFTLFCKNVKLVFQNYVGENKHASYDQWLQGYLWYPDFDYYLFIEDDYFIHPSKLNFDSDIIKTYNDILEKNKTTVGYICSYATTTNHHYHATISNGILNKESLEMLGSGDILNKYYTCAKEYPIEQVAFSDLFINNGVPVYSFEHVYCALFWSSLHKRIDVYSPVTVGNPLFIPLQYLTHHSNSFTI
jgi:hypothetical protein